MLNQKNLTKQSMFCLCASMILGLSAEEPAFFAEQKQLNQALEEALQHSSSFALFGQGKRNARLGDLYFSLNTYPEARLFYEKALLFCPKNPHIRKNLFVTLDRLGLQDPPPSWKKELGMEWICPEAYRWSLFFLFAFAACLARSFHRLARLLDRIAICFLAFALWGYFTKPVDAILTQPAFLLSEPKELAQHLAKEPLLSGAKVELLEWKEDFAKVRLESEVGFLSTTYLFPIW